MDAQIRLSVGHKQGRSYLRSLYTTPPFRVISVGQLHDDGALYLMQMSTSPGVLSGDKYDFRIELEAGAMLQLQSQSYQRLYDMQDNASQTMNITLGRGAHFSQVAHPIVPHRNSAFEARSVVEMGEDSSFLQSEIITCGRKHHGEAFEFRSFSNSVEIRSAGVLRLKDRVWLCPSQTPLLECGLLEGATHQGTLVYQSTAAQEDIAETIEHLYTELSGIENLKFGISATHYPGFVIRALGQGGESLYGAFLKVQEYLWNKTLNK